MDVIYNQERIFAALVIFLPHIVYEQDAQIVGKKTSKLLFHSCIKLKPAEILFYGLISALLRTGVSPDQLKKITVIRC